MSNVMKLNLCHALMKLLQTKRLDQISIKELTETAHCSRMSFYYHFRSLNDLVEYAFLQFGDQVIRKDEGVDSYKNNIRLLMTTATEYRNVITNVYCSTGRAQVEHFLYQVVSSYIRKLLEKENIGKKIPPEKTGQIVDFYKYSCVGVLLDWIEDGMPDNYQGTIDWLSSVIIKTLPGACEAAADS